MPIKKHKSENFEEKKIECLSQVKKCGRQLDYTQTDTHECEYRGHPFRNFSSIGLTLHYNGNVKQSTMESIKTKYVAKPMSPTSNAYQKEL